MATGARSEHAPPPATAERLFPSQFADLLSERARAMLAWPADHDQTLRATGELGRVIEGAIDSAQAQRCCAILDEHLDCHLRPEHVPLPPESRGRADTIPFSQRRWGLDLKKGTPARAVAFEIGLMQMMYSDSVLRLAEAASGFELRPRRVISAVHFYGRGDYVGAHTDGTPTPGHAGWVLLAFSFGNGAPARQLLMWEGTDGLTEASDVADGGSIQILHPPVWHQVTPLVAESPSEPRRWLVGQQFEIVGPRRSCGPSSA